MPFIETHLPLRGVSTRFASSVHSASLVQTYSSVASSQFVRHRVRPNKLAQQRISGPQSARCVQSKATAVDGGFVASSTSWCVAQRALCFDHRQTGRSLGQRPLSSHVARRSGDLHDPCAQTWPFGQGAPPSVQISRRQLVSEPWRLVHRYSSLLDSKVRQHVSPCGQSVPSSQKYRTSLGSGIQSAGKHPHFPYVSTHCCFPGAQVFLSPH